MNNIRRLLSTFIFAQLSLITIHAEEISENDALFNQYIQQRLDASLPGYQSSQQRAATRSAREGLSGNHLRMYDALMERAKQVAEGSLKNTIFEIPASEVCSCGPFTPEQLGLTAFSDGRAVTQFSDLTYDAQQKIENLMEVRMLDVLVPMFLDNPLFLYWWDRIVTSNYYKENEVEYPNVTGTADQLTISGTYKVRMTVGGQFSATRKKETFTVGDKPDTLAIAIENAQAIVDACEGMSTMEKLSTYRNTICDLVDYDDDAVDGGPHVTWDNPWQIIATFDGDPETKIVCEGYSKSFKYLCDLTPSFKDNIECLCVTGEMGGGTGAGAHMWNIVRMDDGRNYLVDLTNCDEGQEFLDYLDSYGLDEETNNSWISMFRDKVFMLSKESLTDADYYMSYTAANDNFGDIEYVYDDMSVESFGEQALTVSDTDYDPEAMAAMTKVNLGQATDIAALLNDHKGETIHINYKRGNLSKGAFSTICLPFDMDVPSTDVAQFFELTSVGLEDGKWTADFGSISGSTLEANKPYLMIARFQAVDFSGNYQIPNDLTARSKTVGQWAFKGIYTDKEWTESGLDYGFNATDGTAADGSFLTEGEFVRCGSGASISPMRCYLSYTPSASTRGESLLLPERIAVRIINQKGDTTGIGELNVKTGEFTNVGWYDLKGRRLNGEPADKGVYIHNGKKIMIK